jgi:rhamnosyltransferase
MSWNSTVRDQGPTGENICAIVVTYFPDCGFPDRLSHTRQQVSHVLIVDNASDIETFKYVQKALSQPNTDVIQNPGNLGIAAALNQGLQWAREQGFAWVLLLDQDTIPSPHMVRTLIRAYDEFPDKDQLAMIGTNCFPDSPSKGKQSIRSGWWTVSKMVITSGTLLQLEAARLIGSFRDEFFIDCVDLEFCLRARVKGFKIVEILEPIMDHSIGVPQTVRLLWFRISTYNHRPWRSYYEIRNFIILVREYVFKDSQWALWSIYVAMKAIPIRLLLEESRLRKLGYMTLGLYDGITKRFDRPVGRNSHEAVGDPLLR